MFVGVLQFEVLVHEATSLKDKRRIVRSIKDRMRRAHGVSIAEVDALEQLDLGVMAVSMVSNSAALINQTFDRIVHELRSLRDGELGEVVRDILPGEPRPGAPRGGAGLMSKEEARSLAEEQL